MPHPLFAMKNKGTILMGLLFTGIGVVVYFTGEARGFLINDHQKMIISFVSISFGFFCIFMAIKYRK